MKEDVSTIAKDLNAKIDGVILKVLENRSTSCREGCSHCCYLLTSITIAEGVLIAQHLLDEKKVEEFLPKLIKAAKDGDFYGVNKVAYFSKGIPCPFLNEEKKCSIYEQRPVCCRTHFSLSEPELCDRNAPPNTVTKSLDLTSLEEPMWALGVSVAKHLGLGQEFGNMVMGPIANMVIFGLRLVTDGEQKAGLERECSGVLEPLQWMHKNIIHLMEEGDGVVRREPLVQIGS